MRASQEHVNVCVHPSVVPEMLGLIRGALLLLGLSGGGSGERRCMSVGHKCARVLRHLVVVAVDERRGVVDEAVLACDLLHLVPLDEHVLVVSKRAFECRTECECEVE